MTLNVDYDYKFDTFIVSSDAGISDGEQTFEQLYEHRNLLFLSLLQTRLDDCWWSEKNHQGAGIKGWIIVGLQLPSGTITYPLEEKYSTLLRTMGVEYVAVAPEWDGHTTEDVLDRLNQAILYNCKNV